MEQGFKEAKSHVWILLYCVGLQVEISKQQIKYFAFISLWVNSSQLELFKFFTSKSVFEHSYFEESVVWWATKIFIKYHFSK